MKKVGVFAVFLLASLLAAGLYGAVNDQVTVTISPEYYTKFKFSQFKLGQPPLRLGAATVGFLATWWTAFIIAPVLGLAASFHTDWRAMATTLARAAAIIVVITPLFGFAGFLFGRLYLSHRPLNWWLPPDLVDRTGFVTAGSIHNFSYLGGITGLIIALGYSVWRLRQARAG